MEQQRGSKWNFFKLSHEQKAVFILLMVLGVGGFVLGFKSFAAHVRHPFQQQIAEYAKAGKYLTEDQKEEQRNEELKQKDSDGDGLSDYDELEVFKTSPYIADSDSDGYDDKTEVYSDNDPNCPEGQNCATQPAEDVGEDAVNPEDLASAGEGASIGDALLSGNGQLGGDLGALQEAGLNIDQLNSITNQSSGEGESATDSTGLPGLNLDSPESVKKFFSSLTPAQIRQAMLEAGIDQEKIDQLSDKQVKELFNQAIETAEESGQLTDFVNQMSQ